MAATYERRSNPPRVVATTPESAWAGQLAHRVAVAVAMTPGWRFRTPEQVDDIAGGAPMVLPDARLVGYADRVLDLDAQDRAGDPAVEALLATYQALIEIEAELARARAEAERARAEAVRDHLTGLLNRRGWEEALEQEQARGERRPASAVVAVIDVDGLKATNDRGGHLAGDMLLKLAADTIAGCVRANDIVARIGGDEFAVLGVDYAEPLPSTFLARIDDALLCSGVSASVGAAVHRSGSRLLEAFAEADRAMYEAKRSRVDAR